MDFWKPFHITYSTKAQKYIGYIHSKTFQPHGKGYFVSEGKKVAIGNWNNGAISKGKTFTKKWIVYWKNNEVVKYKFLK